MKVLRLDMPDDDRFPPAEAYASEFHGEVVKPVSSRPFQFVAVGDLEYQDPEFLVDGLIETDTVGQIFGDPGCCKTFFAVDLSLCVASGVDFHGRTVKQGPVLFIAGEGHNGLVRRFTAWAIERNVSLKGLPMFKSARAAQFLDAASANAVADAADRLAQQHGAPRLIVVDTLARNFGPGDENSTQDMNNFVAAIDDLRERYPGCVVMIIHHSGHGDKRRGRGAMAMKGAVDFEYLVEKEGSHLTVTNVKMKDAPEPADLHFTLESIPLRGETTSAVLRLANEPIVTERRTPAQKLGLSTYQDAALEHAIWSSDGRSFRGVRVDQWRDAFYAKHTGDNHQAKKKAFQRVRSDLTASGVMTVQDDVYLVEDRDLQVAIFSAGKPTPADRGTEGTEGDNHENVPPPKGTP